MGTAMMETAITAKPKSAPAPAASNAAPRNATWCCLAAATASSALLWMCFQPLAWGSYLGWIALVPFLVLVRSQARPSFVYFCAFTCGIVFYVPVLQWMSVADKAMVAAWLALSVYCALFYPAALYCIRCLECWKLPLVVSAPLVWVAFEHLRCWALTGFPWYLLAHTQHDLLPMIQIADIGGVFLVSFVVVAVNALIFDIAYQFPEVRQWFGQADLAPYRYYASLDILNRGAMSECLIRRNLILEGLALVALLIGVYSYGVYRLGQDVFRQGPTVALLQSNIDQRLRENPNKQTHEQVTAQFKKLVDAASHRNPKPDLVIWPETSYPYPFWSVAEDLPPEKEPSEWLDFVPRSQWQLKQESVNTRVAHLIGINTKHLDSAGIERRYNSAILVKPAFDAKGKLDGEFAGKFDKIHRVPFGEYILMEDWFPFLAYLSPYEKGFGIQAGDKFTRFEIGKHRFGVLICYEDTDPFMARRYLEDSDDGKPVDFLVNISNDGWFDGSVEHEEHLAVSRFRAIECRRAMVRAVNMGVSAVIDGNGRVLKPKLFPDSDPPLWTISEEMLRMPDLPVSQWHEFKKKAGIFKAIVPIDGRFSIYALVGDVLPYGCWALLLGGAVWTLGRRRWRAKAV